MQITVSGKQIDIGDALRAHVEETLSAAVAKYFDRPVDAHVVFSRNGHSFRCDASVHLPTGLTAQARAQGGDIYAAFEQAASKIEKQVRRYKRRLRDHHQRRRAPVNMVEAPAYVLQPHDDEAEDTEAGGEPLIIAEMTTPIKSLSVGEAVMQMELAHAPFLIFRNEANGRINVVYQREDGNIGWIDPDNIAEP